MASSVTLAPSLTVWLEPASADGASLSALTVTVTVSTEVLVPSETVTWKVTSEFVRPSGAVKVG